MHAVRFLPSRCQSSNYAPSQAFPPFLGLSHLLLFSHIKSLVIVVLGKNGAPLVSEIVHSRYAEGTDLKNPYLSPLYGDFRGLPPIFIQTGEYETLLDDGLELAKRAEQAGVSVTQKTYAAMPHDFAVCMPDLKESRTSWEDLQKFIDKHMPK